MSPRSEDRRGDRRVAEEWACPNDDCGVGPNYRAEQPDGRVSCDACKQLDRRSTEGNRRMAELELRALERRVIRDMEFATAAVTALAEPLESIGEAVEGVDRMTRDRDASILVDVAELERRIQDIEDGLS